MKGLFAYDLGWLGRQKNLLLIMAALVVFYLVSGIAMFLICLMPLLIMVILTRVLMMQLRPQCSRYLFTFPFNRRDFVVEKYLLILGGSLLSLLILTALTAVFDPSQAKEALFTAVAFVLVILVFGSLLIPLTIKAGEAQQIWLYLISMAVVACATSLSGVFLDFLGPIAAFYQAHQFLILSAAVILAAAAVGISWCVSMWLIGREEF